MAQLESFQIIHIRKELKLTREKFALLLSVSYKTICRWESEGIRLISNSSSQTLMQLKYIFNHPKGVSIMRDILTSTPRIDEIVKLKNLIPILKLLLKTEKVYYSKISEIVNVLKETG